MKVYVLIILSITFSFLARGNPLLDCSQEVDEFIKSRTVTSNLVGPDGNFISTLRGKGVTEKMALEVLSENVPTENVYIDRNKFKYLFGEVTSSKHNMDRSKEMGLIMEHLGVLSEADRVDAENLLIKHFEDSFR